MTKSSWHVRIFSLFPEMFPGPLGCSLAGKALQKGLWSYDIVNFRNYASDVHKSVDDRPCGGGAGMVIRPDIIGKAIEDRVQKGEKIIYMSPRGKVFNQKMANKLVKQENISIIAGRYEGIDQRVIDYYEVEEVSIGDYVLSGGEVAIYALMDACIRLIPGVLGNGGTLEEESFSDEGDFAGLLEYPLYTRPVEWKGLEVPPVLLSGNHAKIVDWRLGEAESITKLRRPDLWNNRKKSEDTNG